MSYYGSVVMTRADVVMSRLPGIDAIGFRHRRLRELGGGWQVLETSGWNDPPDLEQAVAALAGSWNAPVLAAYVADTCAQIHGATAETAVWSGHLADPADVKCGMRHQPPVRSGGTPTALEAQLADWARRAGLTLSAARLSRALRYALEWRSVPDGPYLDPVAQIFELVRAFGFTVIPAPRAYAFDPDDEPFAEVTAAIWGLAAQARSAAAYRTAGARRGRPAGWEAAAITLETDIYAALYGGGHPPAALAARAGRIIAYYRAVQHDAPPPPREITVNGQPVANIQRITHDIGARVIANQVATRRAHDRPAPDGTGFSDPVAGPGTWPDLA
ncbi:hypothetical protein [Dactylosporangium matsuzakiense]|uniref:Uncharacterized protein n=1 Tax=Dactylosporangium matsuzakiense TaxID=53360 RepID=A0A9W6NMK0_9ACTN|nr:hypothetical protein [Dactylosporangium matsuzakiense]UWZ41620.1 hypothetical protein Dmats_28680 [Dactylosporangium matsuzakiense]GLL02306.1 hypothetical protein GCM10017581_040480 [Dactylosporangium matsuzakiense]